MEVIMKSIMEKISLLALSLMLVSTYAISPALPEMIAYYSKQGIATAQIELLVSLPSFAIIAVLLVTPLLSRFLSERLMIVTGLLLLALGGSFPVFVQTYHLVVMARLLMGVGIGLINARAISMISQRFKGRERIKMLGYRGSAEVLGSALLTFLAGQLLGLSWSATFILYAFALLILALYLLFVSQPQSAEQSSSKDAALSQETSRLSVKERIYIMAMACYAGFVILINSINTLRIPVIVDHFGYASAQAASIILSLMMLMGILSGAVFSSLVAWCKSYLMSLVAIVLGLGLLLMWLANSVLLLGLGALVTGFVYSLGVTFVFNHVSEHMAKEKLHTATTLVLLGCNLGGALAPVVMGIFARLSPSLIAPFLILGIASLLLGLSLLAQALRGKGQSTPRSERS